MDHNEKSVFLPPKILIIKLLQIILKERSIEHYTTEFR